MGRMPDAVLQQADTRQAARDHFDKWAAYYDRSWLNELAFLPALRVCQEEITRWQVQRRHAPYRLLDVGCGTGTFIQWMAHDPAAELLVGLDYSASMLRRCREKLDSSPLAGKLRTVQADSERLPFADESFDVITCCHSFHHYPQQAEVIRGFHRVLRRGGLLVIVDGFRDNVVGWVVFDVAVAWVEKQVHHAPWSQVRDMIRGAGFALLRQRKTGVLAPLLVTVAIR